MTIEYLQVLKANPTKGRFTDRGISESEIQQLEQLYNNGSLFPKVLREYLFLAGDFCCWVDGGPYDSQEEMQEVEREEISWMVTIIRPFYVIDVSSPDAQLIVFLDEGADDPILYQITSRNGPTDDGLGGRRTLKRYIEGGIEAYKQGIPVY